MLDETIAALVAGSNLQDWAVEEKHKKKKGKRKF